MFPLGVMIAYPSSLLVIFLVQLLLGISFFPFSLGSRSICYHRQLHAVIVNFLLLEVDQDQLLGMKYFEKF